MRIAYLFDPALTTADPFHFVIRQWLNGLAESQNEVKVVATRGARAHLPELDSKIDWAEPVIHWGWWELHKVLAPLLSFNPEVIHLVLGRPSRFWNNWPLLAQLPGPRIVVSCSEEAANPLPWAGRAMALGPTHTNALAIPPLKCTFDPRMEQPTIFVPGPLRSHLDWRKTLEDLRQMIPRRSNWHFHLGWQWSDVPLPDRRELRQQWLGTIPASLYEMHDSAVEVQAEILSRSNWLVTGPLKSGWMKAIMNQTGQVYGLQSLDHPEEWDRQLLNVIDGEVQTLPKASDQSLNQLIRAYHQLLVR